MKRLLFIIVLSVAGMLSYAQDNDSAAVSSSLFFGTDSTEINVVTAEMADNAYIQGDYATAAAMYEEILANQGISSALYLNLGNSYFKLDEIAKAILNYERASLLNPSDEDVRFNLDVARTKIVDKETTVNELFVITWFKRIAASMNVNGWGVSTVILWTLMLLSAGAFFLSRRVGIKKISFGLSIVFLLLAFMSFMFASAQKKSLINSEMAIIMSPSVTVKSTPNENGTELFIIHEGRKVRILDATMKDWVEIRLNDGNEGWIQASDMEKI